MFDDYYRRTWVDTDGDIGPHQTELATQLRIPILATGSPRWNYLTGIVVADTILDKGAMPTDDEVREVADWLRRYNLYYNQAFLKAMRDFAPYDIDGGANLGYLMKRPTGGWCYQKRTWSHGWRPMEKDVPLSLTEVLNRCFDGWSAIPESLPVRSQVEVESRG